MIQVRFQQVVKVARLLFRFGMYPDYQNMPLVRLIDLLVEKTQALSAMRNNNIPGTEFDDLKEEVRHLQAVIESRKVISIYRTRSSGGPSETA